ncbi:MAG: hypothetical protein AAB319_04140, partial [Pseudomonadota bacterium]
NFAIKHGYRSGFAASWSSFESYRSITLANEYPTSANANRLGGVARFACDVAGRAEFASLAARHIRRCNTPPAARSGSQAAFAACRRNQDRTDGSPAATRQRIAASDRAAA